MKKKKKKPEKESDQGGTFVPSWKGAKLHFDISINEASKLFIEIDPKLWEVKPDPKAFQVDVDDKAFEVDIDPDLWNPEKKKKNRSVEGYDTY